ncbi:MAG: lactate utilization protein [Bacteroidetes bacterium]|nr:lactate utilization protein [Bacteroidota bacterium]
MSDYYQEFIEASEKKAFDKNHRKTVNFNISKYDAVVPKGKMQYCNLSLAKERAAHIKHKTINDLGKYLVDFEANFVSRGGKIIWALDQVEAVKEILNILKKYDSRYVVKSKSMITEEIDINAHLKDKKIESLETDLGEYIVQLAGEKPYHIITPAMHKSKEDIAELFYNKFGFHKDATPEEITAFVRRLLRDKFITADVGITGANFIISDIGGIALTENEGNALMTVSFPKIHIVIAGIERIIPSMKDLDLFWPLLSTHGTGQNITVYNTILTGPRQEDEKDGPDEMYVILLDNGRTEVLDHEEQRRALSCIKCGACLNGCPVYKNIGGHAYGTTYSGPIGSVITPYMRGMQEFKHLSFASSLCGKCTDVCPVKINLHKLLLFNRRDSVKMGYTTRMEKITMYVWKNAMKRRWFLEKATPKMKNFMLNKFFSKAWGPRREIPTVHSKTFNRLWKEQRNFGK